MLSRLGAALCLLLVLLASIWGRSLQRILEGNKSVFLALGLAALAFGLLWLFSNFRVTNYKRLLKVLPLVIIALILMITIMELSIVAAIERIHFIKYGALTVFFYFSTDRPHGARRCFDAAGASAAIGAMEECVQYFHPERVFDLRDIWLNAAGCLYGSVTIVLIRMCASALAPLPERPKASPNQ